MGGQVRVGGCKGCALWRESHLQMKGGGGACGAGLGGGAPARERLVQGKACVCVFDTKIQCKSITEETTRMLLLFSRPQPFPRVIVRGGLLSIRKGQGLRCAQGRRWVPQGMESVGGHLPLRSKPASLWAKERLPGQLQSAGGAPQPPQPALSW